MNAVTSPGADLRARVIRMARVGMPEHQIAFSLRIRISTLQAFFTEDIIDSQLKLNLEILETLARLAKSGKSPATTIFWAKTRCGFFSAINPDSKKSPQYPPMPEFVVTGPNGERMGDNRNNAQQPRG